MDEVAAMLQREELKEVEDLDMVYSKMLKMEELGDPAFPLMAKLGSSICTIYNSSSPAERDFSLMKTFVGDPARSCTKMEMLKDKMQIKAEVNSFFRSCAKRKANKKKFQAGERKTAPAQTNHCHCDLWRPSEELLVTVGGGAAAQRYKN